MAEYAVFQSSGVDDASELRVNLSGLLPSIGSLKSRSGLLDGGGAVTLNSGMSINVSKFRAWIQGVSGALQGGYLAVLDADKVLTFADGSGSNRTDLVVARIYHDAYDTSGFTKFAVEIFQGTPGGGTPATPANAVKLAEKVITPTMSAGTGGLGTAPTDKRPPRLVTAGSVVPVVDATDRDTLEVFNGLTVHRYDNNATEQRINGNWCVIADGASLPEIAKSDDAGKTVANNNTDATIHVSGIGDLVLGSSKRRIEYGFNFAWDSTGNAAAFVKVKAGGTVIGQIRLHNDNDNPLINRWCYIGGTSRDVFSGNVTITVEAQVDSGGASISFVHLSGQARGVPC